MASEILIVDDESDIRKLVQGILEDEGYETRLAAHAQDAYAAIQEKPPHLIILDIWLQGSEHDGLQILSQVKKEHPHIPVVMISGHGTIETAVSSIKEGAYDFIEKPFKSDRLLRMIERALETAALKRENAALKQKAGGVSDLIGQSSGLQGIRQIIERVAPTKSRVLLTGEPGAGKDVAARHIWQLSNRRDQPFLVLNCATLRADSLEVELFGAVDGAMGEVEKTGILEQANGGTLLLDEVADMPLETQGKIVSVLQDQRFQKIGGGALIETDVRILASTNRDLESEIRDGNFRQDLYYRLNVVPVYIPPLREHAQDIPDLIDYFSGLLHKQSGLPVVSFSSSALAAMQAYEWPGNIRQLRNVIEWIIIMNNSAVLESVEVEHLPPEVRNQLPGVAYANSNDADGLGGRLMDLPLRDAREMFEREYLQSQVNRFGGNISKTAQFIGMERSALHRKLKSLKILNSSKASSADDSYSLKKKRA